MEWASTGVLDRRRIPPAASDMTAVSGTATWLPRGSIKEKPWLQLRTYRPSLLPDPAIVK
jgi:hypothetical protein